MNNNLCPQCGAPLNANATKCEYCGAPINQPVAQQTQQPQPEKVVYVQQPAATVVNPERNNWPIKNKIVAALLAIFLGSLGVHKFYLGQTGRGVLYLIFCWTYIPAIIGFIEGIIMLCSKDENFQIKYKCRL